MRTKLLIAIIGLSTLLMLGLASAEDCNYYFSWASGCQSEICQEGFTYVIIGTGEIECTCESPGFFEECSQLVDDPPPICEYWYELDPDCANLTLDLTFGIYVCDES